MNTEECCRAEQLAKILKTLGGAVFHELKHCDRNEIDSQNWENLCSYLGIPSGIIRSVENVSDIGFVISTRVLSIEYVHDEWEDLRRVVHVTYHSTSKYKVDPLVVAHIRSSPADTA